MVERRKVYCLVLAIISTILCVSILNCYIPMIGIDYLPIIGIITMLFLALFDSCYYFFNNINVKQNIYTFIISLCGLIMLISFILGIQLKKFICFYFVAIPLVLAIVFANLVYKEQLKKL